MLEFKNVSLKLADGAVTSPFSLIVDKGDLVSITGVSGSGKSRLLLAIMGLQPVNNGFITLDGELITPGSSRYFRSMMAYIPQNFPKDNFSLSDIARYIFGLKNNGGHEPDFTAIYKEWEKFGLDSGLMKAKAKDLSDDKLQLALLSFLPMLRKKIILIDNIYQSEAVNSYLSILASSGSEIVYTCEQNLMPCNKSISL